MGANTTSLRSGRAILAWLVLYVVGLLVQGAHVAFERHEVCEHGEFSHVEAATEGAHDDEACASTEGEWARVASPEGDGEHHHCGIAVGSPVVAASFASPCGIELFEAPREPARPVDTPRAGPIERLRLAPHHSPPRS